MFERLFKLIITIRGFLEYFSNLVSDFPLLDIPRELIDEKSASRQVGAKRLLSIYPSL